MDDESSDSPGPLPTLKLFNNSNRPPVRININEAQYTTLQSKTHTHTPTASSRASRAPCPVQFDVVFVTPNTHKKLSVQKHKSFR